MVSFTQITRSAAIAFAFVAMTNCSESATSPTGSSSLTPNFNMNGAPNANSGRSHSHFTADNVANGFDIGASGHIYISRSNICDRDKSLYGPGTWNLPCSSENKDVNIDAQASTTSKGHTRIDFNPPMRFNPNSGDVILVINDPALANNPNSVILYCNDLGVCVDEGKSDKALITHHDTTRGIIWRKIRHFSGYVGSSGDCDPNVDPTCGNQS